MSIDRPRKYTVILGPTAYTASTIDNMVNSTLAEAVQHPYYPVEAQLLGYAANEWPMIPLVASFLGRWGALLLLTLAVVSYVSPQLPKMEKAAILWFVFSKLIVIALVRVSDKC